MLLQLKLILPRTLLEIRARVHQALTKVVEQEVQEQEEVQRLEVLEEVLDLAQEARVEVQRLEILAREEQQAQAEAALDEEELEVQEQAEVLNEL